MKTWTVHISPSLLCLAVATMAPSLFATDFYVSPSGSSSGSGAITSPWSLATALAHPPAVRPGDTIWLRGGVYQGQFTSSLTGAPNAPVILRQYPGERATIDGGSSRAAALTVNGSWAWYWGFEVMFSDPRRLSSQATSWPSDIGRGEGIGTSAQNVKFINLVIHDTAQGVSLWTGAVNSELYGSLIYNNGWQAPDRGHGHSVYVQNQNGTKRIVDNIMFNSYQFGIHAYGSSSAWLNNIHIEGNTMFGHGSVSSDGRKAEILLGGGNVAQNPVVIDNYMYGFGSRAASIGYASGCNLPRIERNYFATIGGESLILNCTNILSMIGNTFYGSPNFSSSLFSSNTYLNSSSATQVFIRRNQYEPGRANITVYNWGNQASVPVNLSQAGIAAGAKFEIRDAQNFYGPPILRATYVGGNVSLPMGNRTIAQPIGAPYPANHTAPQFGTFVVLPDNSGTPIQNNAPSVSAGPNQTIALGVTASLTGTASDDGQPSAILNTNWSQVSGPGSAVFSKPNQAATAVSFNVAGTYVLRLTASDGALSAGSSVTITVNPAPAGGAAVLRINAGGSSFTDSAGITWNADTGFSGQSQSYTSQFSVDNTGSPALYQSERWSETAVNYQFSVNPGVYTVNLKFAEVFFSGPGQRTFNVALNGQTVLSNFDIVAAAGGPYKAIDRPFAVTVTGNQLNIALTKVISNPKISGIEIIQQSGTETAPLPPPPTTPPPTGSTFQPIRINAGGGSYTDAQGRTWSADTGYAGGTAYTTSNVIASADAPLYRSERWNSSTLSYRLAAPDGNYVVTLRFAEIYFTDPGKRVFHVRVNGQTVLSNFDPFVAAGGANRPVDRQFPVSVTGGNVAIDLIPVVSNPKISAIALEAAGSATPIDPPTGTLVAVNAGGGQYVDGNGVTWSADQGFTGGQTYTALAPPSGTPSPALYASERWAAAPFEYVFSVPDGTRKVTLKFAEMWFTASSGQRVFHVQINGQQVLTNFDIAAAAGGPKKAVDRQFDVNVTGGQVRIRFVPVVSNPKVNGIRID